MRPVGSLRKTLAPGVVLAVVLSGCGPSENDTAKSAVSELQWESPSLNTLYVGTLAPQENHLPIGQFHRWELELRSASGDAVAGAEIAISGGMPAHGHGLPTAPQVTRYLGDGRYLIEGMRFNMAGAWVLEFQINAPQGNDRLRYELELKH